MAIKVIIFTFENIFVRFRETVTQGPGDTWIAGTVRQPQGATLRGPTKLAFGGGSRLPDPVEARADAELASSHRRQNRDHAARPGGLWAPPPGLTSRTEFHQRRTQRKSHVEAGGRGRD